MNEYLYPNFNYNISQYKACVKLWATIAEDLLKEIKRVKEWQPFVQSGLKGDRIEPDAIIYSLYNPAILRAFSIKQLKIDYSTSPTLYCHLELFGEEYLSEPIEHLHIGCELTTDNTEKVKLILKKWFDPKVTVADMSVYLKKMGIGGDY